MQNINDSMYMKGGNTDAEKAAYKLGYEAKQIECCGCEFAEWIKAEGYFVNGSGLWENDSMDNNNMFTSEQLYEKYPNKSSPCKDELRKALDDIKVVYSKLVETASAKNLNKLQSRISELEEGLREIAAVKYKSNGTMAYIRNKAKQLLKS